MNFEEKMKMRNGYLMDIYAANNASPAQAMSLGFAAFTVYMQQAHQVHVITENYCSNPLFVEQVSKWIKEIKEKGMKNILAS